MYKAILFLSALILFQHCNTRNDTAQNNYYITGYIVKISKENDNYCLIADTIKLFYGDSALSIAKSLGDAEYEITETTDTIWFVPNDYYIYNENKDSLKFVIDKNCKIDLFFSDETTNYQVEMKENIPIDTLISKSDEYLVFELYIVNNQVKHIRQLWFP